MSSDDHSPECPVCESPLPADSQASESHVATCIANHLEGNKDDANISTTAHEVTATQASGSSSVMSSSTTPAKSAVPEEDQCPICHISLQSKGIGEREAHVNACVDSIETHDPTNKSTDLAPPYSHKQHGIGNSYQTSTDTSRMFSQAGGVPPQVEESGKGQPNPEVEAINAKRRSTGLRGLFASLGVGGEAKTKEQKAQENVNKAFALMTQRWGPQGSPVYEMVMRYMKATRMQQHWEYLGEEHPRQFAKRLNKGYMEPIPTAWVQSRQLAYLYPEGSLYETPAEKRLYYLLNNGVTPDGSQHAKLYPLNINRDRNTIIRRGNARNARQVRIDAQKLAAYGSPGDVFHNDKQIKSHEYSMQVTNTVNEARQRALHELADGILHGTDHLETMLLIDVSGSMTWNPHQGVVGPDGMRRYHDQPSNIALVQHLVHRVLHHMIPRAQKEHPQTTGIDTVTFSTMGNYVGQLSTSTFQRDWYSKIRLGGGTQVMQGWQVVKNTYFTHQNRTYGHGRFDPVYGWQPTPGMPKLSLLVFLDGEAFDMDEFELELLGETWAYVTIALVGMENCPHHHSHAIELERVAKFNPHVGFFDVHGRVCERLVVEDLLGSVYPVDPPVYSEILKPEFDLPADELPAYKA